MLKPQKTGTAVNDYQQTTYAYVIILLLSVYDMSHHSGLAQWTMQMQVFYPHGVHPVA
jgi:hypothetical protein